MTVVNPNNLDGQVIADAICEVAEAARRLNNSKLTRRAVVLLLHDACGGNVGKRDIDMVLTQAHHLTAIYLKKPVAE